MRKKTVRQIVECYSRGSYVSKNIFTWKIQLMTKKSIEEEKQGCHTKSHFWFNAEEVQLAVHEFIFYSVDKLSAQKLAKAVGDYLGSQIVINTVQEILEKESTLEENSTKRLRPGLRIEV